MSGARRITIAASPIDQSGGSPVALPFDSGGVIPGRPQKAIALAELFKFVHTTAVPISLIWREM
jgi:hypothetical protein